jgi:hypothetical protein
LQLTSPNILFSFLLLAAFETAFNTSLKNYALVLARFLAGAVVPSRKPAEGAQRQERQERRERIAYRGGTVSWVENEVCGFDLVLMLPGACKEKIWPRLSGAKTGALLSLVIQETPAGTKR